MHAPHSCFDCASAEPSRCECGGPCSGGPNQGFLEATGDDSMAAERILASSPIESYHHEVMVTFHANEPGVVDLARLVVSVTALGTTKESRDWVLDEHARVTSILIFNGHQKVRGLDYVEAPAGVFSPRRRQCSIDLGTLRLESGDTLAVTVVVGEEWSRAYRMLLASAVPFRPDAERSSSGVEGQPVEPHVFLASPARRIAAGSFGQLTLDFEEDGIVDLATLQLLGAPCANSQDSQDVLSRTLVESIRLPSGEDLVLGNQDYDDTTQDDDDHDDTTIVFPVAAPASKLSHLERTGAWTQVGCLRVRRGQQITLRLRYVGANSETTYATFSTGLRYYPETSPGSTDRVRPSDFFDQEASCDEWTWARPSAS